MEVVISAAVLLLVVLGVMAGLDAVAGTAGANKARTVAAVLAEKDQEELRSLKTADLNQLESLIPGPRTVMVDGVPYTITSDARIVTDAKGEDISCALDDGEGSFVRITSTVTSPMTGAKVKPVTLSSIVAPEPGSGTLVARVRNAKDQPVKDMPVQATLTDGPAKTVMTNEAGCAVFGTMESGSYEIEVDRLNWVDPDGNQEVVKTATVASGTLTTVEFLYDLAATLTVNVETTPAGGTRQADDSYGIIAGHNGISTTFRMFPGDDVASPPAAATHVLTGLFPFHEDEYTIYSGRCTDADPTAGARPDDFFELLDTIPDGGPYDATPMFTPGERRTITISEQPINIAATWHTGTNTPVAINSTSSNRAYAYAYPKGSTCPAPSPLQLGEVLGGKAQRPGVPFGTYDVCVQRWRDNTRGWYHMILRDIPVQSSSGSAPLAMALSNNTTSPPTTQTACPAS